MSDTPKVGDRVRVIVEGTVTKLGELGMQIRRPDLDGATCYVEFRLGEPEILERADDPKNDPVGTIRAETDDSAVYVKTQDRRWTRVSSRSCEGGFSFAENEMGMSKVIGTVPGTPAAEAAADKPKLARLMAGPDAFTVASEFKYYRGRVSGFVYRSDTSGVVEYHDDYDRWNRSSYTHEDMRSRADLFTKLDGKPEDVD